MLQHVMNKYEKLHKTTEKAQTLSNLHSYSGLQFCSEKIWII